MLLRKKQSLVLLLLLPQCPIIQFELFSLSFFKGVVFSVFPPSHRFAPGQRDRDAPDLPD